MLRLSARAATASTSSSTSAMPVFFTAMTAMMEMMRQASAAMLMMPEVNSASTVSTSPEKRAATSPGFWPCQRAGGQPGKLPGHFRPQRVGHFLAKEHQQAFLRGGKPPFQRQTAKVKQHCCKGERDACGEPVNDTGQQQRRQQ